MSTSQRGFTKGLMRRYRLLLNIKNYVRESSGANLEGLEIKYTPNLPKAVFDELKAIIDEAFAKEEFASAVKN